MYYLKRVPPCGRLSDWGLKSDLTDQFWVLVFIDHKNPKIINLCCIKGMKYVNIIWLLLTWDKI